MGNGQPVVGDMCIGSALHANGMPYPHATAEDGEAIDRLTGQKHDKYPELVTSDRVHFVVLACEEGGRWGPDVFEVINDLVRLKVAPLHPLLRRSAALAYTRRWWSILAGCTVRGDRLHPRPGSAGVGAASTAAARLGPSGSGHRAGTVAPGLCPGPGPRSGPQGSFSVG